jgi:hypothetical protein
MEKNVNIQVSKVEDIISGERFARIVCSMDIPEEAGMCQLEAIEQLTNALSAECKAILELNLYPVSP